MLFLSLPRQLGIEWGDETVKYTLLSTKRGSTVVEKCFVKETANVKPLDIGGKDQTTCISLPAKDLLVRRTTLPPVKKREQVEALLSYQMEPTLPLPLEEVALTFHAPKVSSKSESVATVFLLPKERLTQEFDADIIVFPPVALFAYDRWAYPESQESHLYLHISNELITLSLIIKGQVIGSHQIIKNSAATPIECARIASALAKLSPEDRPLVLMPVGDFALNMELVKSIAEKSGLRYQLAGEQADFAVAIGCALLTAHPQIDELNAAKQTACISPLLRRLVKPLCLYYALLVLGCFSLLGICNWTLKKREKSLYDKALSIKSMQQNLFPELVFATDSADTPPTADNAYQILKEIREKNSALSLYPFPLEPNTPSVGSILNWVATLVKGDGETPPLQVQRFSYQLVKRPTKKTPTERYQARIDLEFTTSATRYAREFYEALLRANDFVNPKEEVRWNVRNDGYVASFILKDRTFYP